MGQGALAVRCNKLDVALLQLFVLPVSPTNTDPLLRPNFMRRSCSCRVQFQALYEQLDNTTKLIRASQTAPPDRSSDATIRRLHEHLDL